MLAAVPCFMIARRLYACGTIAASADTGDANYISASRFVMPAQGGTASSLSVYVSSPIGASPNNQFQVAIYADQGGLPGALIVSSPSQTIVPTATHDVRFLATATQMCRIKLPSWGAMFAMRMVQSKRAAPQI